MSHEIHVGSSLPPGWDAFSLGSKASFVTSGSRGWARFYSESGDLFLRSQNIRSGHLDLEDRQHVLPPAGAEGERTRVQPNDLLVTITGNSVGNVAISSDKLGISYISQHVGMIRLVNPSLAPYACWYLSPGAPGNKQIMDAQTGQSKPGLNLQNLKDLVVAAPKDKRERDFIVAALDDIQAQADEMQMLLSKKRMLKQAAMQELLTGKRRLPGFEGEWEVKKLGDIAEITMGQSPSSYNYNKQGRGLPLIQGNADIKNRETVPRVFTTQITKRGFNGDILMTVRAPVGEVSRANIDVCLGRGVCAICFRSDFLYHFLVFLEPAWAKHSKGSTFDSVNAADIKAVDVHLPCDSLEQDAIAESLGEMNAELTVLEIRLAKAHALKQGMLQQLLTGKIRLT